MGGITTDCIVNDSGLRTLAIKIMEETIAIANQDLLSRGYDADTFLGDSEVHIFNFSAYEDFWMVCPTIVLTWKIHLTKAQLMLQLTDNIGAYKTSTMLDLIHRRPMEVQHLFRIPLDIAAKVKVPAPHLETIVLQIESYQRMHHLY
jgi:ketopantoate reductase